MSSMDLKTWMERTGKDVSDIVSITKLNADTVKAFLNGDKVHASTRRSLEMMVQLYSKGSGQVAS